MVRIPVDQTEIINEIHAKMKKDNVSRADLAQRMGVEKGFVSQILSGGVPISAAILAAINRALGTRWVLE